MGDALASWMLPTQQDGLRTVRLTSRGLYRRWSAVTLKGRAPSIALTRFVELLRDGRRSTK